MKLIIIGAGPGGYETALLAAKRGVEVILIEAGPVGGTCLNEGCIPTKSFCRNAELLDRLHEAEQFGVTGLSYGFDFGKVRERKNAVVDQLRGGVESLLSHKLITLVRGKAYFKDAHTVVVQLNEAVDCQSEGSRLAEQENVEMLSEHKDSLTAEFTADYIIIATGSTSASLPIPGADLPGVITSKEILDIEDVPQRLCVIGGGVIGLEFASIFKSFGSEVTVIEYCKDILPRFDSDLSKRLRQSLVKRGIDILTQSQVLSIIPCESADQQLAEQEHGEMLHSLAGLLTSNPHDNVPASGQSSKLSVIYSRKGKEDTVLADKVLMAVGRKANTASLNLDDIGINYTKKGVEVNGYMQTSIPHIYAIGDINGQMMLAHAATFQGIVALDHMMGIKNEIDLSVMPAAVFTSPEAASVGMTEEECKEKGIPVKCLKSFYRANGKAVSMAETDGFCKIIVESPQVLPSSNAVPSEVEESPSCRILGCHLYGPHASDLIHEMTALISRKATIRDLQDIIHAHPTLSEVLQSAAHQ